MDFSESIKTLLLAGIGAAAMTTERSKELVGDLIKKGALTVEEGKILNEELKHKVEAKKNERVADYIEKMSKAERDMLRAKLDEIDSRGF